MVLAICVSCWLLAIPMVFDGGIYLFKLMDWHTASWAILLIGFAELIVPAWFYGCNRFLANVAEMKMKFGRFLHGYWWFCWVVLAPVTCLVSAFYLQCLRQRLNLPIVEYLPERKFQVERVSTKDFRHNRILLLEDLVISVAGLKLHRGCI